MDFLDQLINMPESKEVKKKIEELRDGFKSGINVRGSAYKNFDKPWYYYLPIIFYCIKEAKVMGENITYLGNNKSSVIDIVDKMKYKKSEKKDIKDWLEERLGNLYNRPNIFSLTSQINPTLFGDEVYKKYLYLSF